MNATTLRAPARPFLPLAGYSQPAVFIAPFRQRSSAPVAHHSAFKVDRVAVGPQDQAMLRLGGLLQEARARTVQHTRQAASGRINLRSSAQMDELRQLSALAAAKASTVSFTQRANTLFQRALGWLQDAFNSIQLIPTPAW